MATGARQEDTTTAALPGYQAGPDESGTNHSARKLAEAGTELERLLRSINENWMGDGASGPGNQETEIEQSLPSVLGQISCQSEKDSWAYRCRCAFQLVADNDQGGALRFHYAMRHEQQPFLLGSEETFPIATRRIQQAMKDLVEYVLNAPSKLPSTSHLGGDPRETVPPVLFLELKRHLTSVTFAAAWHDIPESDCIVTLHYDQPLKVDTWQEEAAAACQMLCLRQLNGRSKKCLVSAKPADGEESHQTLRDTLWMHQPPPVHNDEDTQWNVTLAPPFSNPATQGWHNRLAIPVHYEKPNTAFYHPNAGAMTKALEWMLGRLSWIVREKATVMTNTRTGHMLSPSPRMSMLEMYCGCGAHTVALAKSGLLEEIVAVELDQRLVEACRVNVRLNGLEIEDKEDDTETRPTETRRVRVRVIQQDASKWAKQASKKVNNNKNNAGHQQNSTRFQNHPYHDILLVDPPRMGLDETVCRMATESQFEHFLYISCGRKALLRDLKRLSPHFQVIDCKQLDLFPRTDAIETLVHLRRRRPIHKVVVNNSII
jgi:hypothetical protein